jgi:hypothetical protein
LSVEEGSVIGKDSKKKKIINYMVDMEEIFDGKREVKTFRQLTGKNHSVGMHIIMPE